MPEKTCFKCFRLLPIEEFYKHPEMPDGHVNKCKDCNKIDVKNNYLKKITDPVYKELERKRGRLKYRRLYTGTGKVNLHSLEKHRTKYPEKEKARKLNLYKIVSKGKEGHHWSYNDEHLKDIIELTKRHHMKAHRFLVYDPERFMYRRYDTNELLYTREKHLDFILHCINNKED